MMTHNYALSEDHSVDGEKNLNFLLVPTEDSLFLSLQWMYFW